MAEKITDALVKGLEPPATGNRIIYDGGHRDAVTGFGVRITKAGARSFVLAYRFADVDSGRRRTNEFRYTIGAYPAWSVNAARAEAKDWRRRIDRGETHPMAERTAKREAAQAAREAETYEEAVEDYIKRYQIGTKRNATADEVKRVLLREGAEWLNWPVASITAAEIRKLLEAIRDGDGAEGQKPRPYLANRTFAYLSTFFRWCAEPGVEKVSSSPMLRLRRPWEGEESRERFYDDDELKAIWGAADRLGGVQGAFVKLVLLTGKRKGALSSMRWADLNDDGVWKPAGDTRRRRGNKRLHGAPLPPLALRVLRPLRPAAGDGTASPFVFPGRVGGTHLVPGSKIQDAIRKGSGVGDFMFHGLRHTVETRLAELGVPPHVRDVLLDHVGQRGSGAGYDHYDYQDEARAALQRWADHIEALVAPEGARVLR